MAIVLDFTWLEWVGLFFLTMLGGYFAVALVVTIWLHIAFKRP